MEVGPRTASGQARTALPTAPPLTGAARPGLPPRRPALERPPFVLVESAPHPEVLAKLYGPLQALLSDRAPAADGLGLGDLKQGGAGAADGEEQVGIFLDACRVLTPVLVLHGESSSIHRRLSVPFGSPTVGR